MPVIQTNKPLKPRPKNDFYPTPIEFALGALQRLPTWVDPDFVLDPGSGKGVFGKAVKTVFPGVKRIIGVEPFVENENKRYYDFIYNVDFCTWQTSEQFDLVCGNPPYALAEKFVRKSMEVLKPGGHLVFLLRLQFLASRKRQKLWQDYPLQQVIVCCNRPSFTGDGKTNCDDYAFLYWQKNYRGKTNLSWSVF